eukprot:gnl/TRDRNA2_/TRDRNA2_194938_c0_seq1.p1 gnl/TRDRNA2_/TRDRNA2_194938_c0~~gnl/TRDRNA2_/TRDRNA2_194938_c0_seq1.p1  ORF type:complete len:105 (+),score=4.83 gnl/TRDRNA2_/TRDRNA2_194938_c0_seq1:62-376(+)
MCGAGKGILLIVWLIGSQVAGHSVARLRLQTQQHNDTLLHANWLPTQIEQADVNAKVVVDSGIMHWLFKPKKISMWRQILYWSVILVGFILLFALLQGQSRSGH